jgi:hypothetical protein
MPEPQPLILTDASIKISDDGTVAGLKELACLANHIELTPDVAVTTLDTMCGSKDYPGTVKWALIATLYQSFDPDATEEVLSAALALGEPAPYEIIGYKSQPVSATNPKWTGEVIPQPYPPINGDAGDASTIELEWSCTAAPTKSITPVTGFAAMTLAELQAAAETAGLPTSGTKADLIARLEGATTVAA